MADAVTIQWCPSCKAWGRSTRGAADVLSGIAPTSGFGEFVFDYRRVLHQCDACGIGFVTTNVTKCDAKYHWHASAELDRLAKLPVERSFGVRTSSDAFRWDVHPELADFSASVEAN